MQAIRPAQIDQWAQEAASGLGEGHLPVVLDVREPWELQTASVKAAGFELLTIPMRTLPARLAELDPERPVACLCHHGARSAMVAQFLINNGFTQVVNIDGGIDAWSRERDPGVPLY